VLPAYVKPIDSEKVLIKMDKKPERFPLKHKENLDLEDIMGQDDDGRFKGTDLADVDKAFKYTLPHLPVVDFKS